MDKVQENVNKIKSEVAHYNPLIVAVTKYFDETRIMKYYEMGFRDFGENRVKAAIEKIEKLPEEIVKNSRFHLIGHLQSNKTKYAVGNFYLIHSIDSFHLAKCVSDEALKRGIKQKILLQVNNAHEEQKGGFEPDELKKQFPEILKLNGIEILGLMNIAPVNTSQEELHKLFRNIKQIKDELECEFGVELKQISMGMSHDYKIALEEGATIIRLGRILFE
jgi:PLP dependent protein